MEIEFPLEFIVHGTPVSAQARRASSRDEWKARVKGASVSSLPSPHFVSGDRIAVTLYYFPDGAMDGDIDNIVKLTIDALIKHIYFDDSQVERIVVQKFERGRLFTFSAPTAALGDAIAMEPPILYIKVSSDPFEELK